MNGYVTKYPFTTVLIIGLLCVNVTSISDDWDILIFTQHWPLTVCIQWKEKQEQHSCLLPAKNTWAIHGIWPTKVGSRGPEYCNKTTHFDPAQLQPIMKNLVQYWPDVYNETDHYSLWRHEWTKHGTCAIELKALDTELKYFEQGISWMNSYGMEKMLSQAGIVPGSQSYLPQTMWNAVTSALGKKPSIQCIKDKERDIWYIFEIRICFNKTLNLIDCDEINYTSRFETNMETNCPLHLPIVYPAHVAFGMDTNTDDQEYFRAPWLRQFLEILLWIQWMTL